MVPDVICLGKGLGGVTPILRMHRPRARDEGVGRARRLDHPHWHALRLSARERRLGDARLRLKGPIAESGPVKLTGWKLTTVTLSAFAIAKSTIFPT